jgi:hypothetical protein
MAVRTCALGTALARIVCHRLKKCSALKNLARISNFYSGFEALAAVIVKSCVLWDITPCNLLQMNRRFGRKCRKQSCRFFPVCCLANSSNVKVEATSQKIKLDVYSAFCNIREHGGRFGAISKDHWYQA